MPRFEYLVIDERHLPRERLEPLDSPVDGVFQLEQARGVEEMRRIIDTLLEVLDDPELKELRRDMATWLRRAVLPARLPGVELSELQDLQEAKSMLAERQDDWNWPVTWMAEGYEKGRKEGLLDGQRTAVKRLAEAKFGPMEPADERRIAEAPAEQLDCWLEKVLSADTVDELFRAPPRAEK